MNVIDECDEMNVIDEIDADDKKQETAPTQIKPISSSAKAIASSAIAPSRFMSMSGRCMITLMNKTKQRFAGHMFPAKSAWQQRAMVMVHSWMTDGR